MTNRKVFESDGESVDMRPARRKGKKPDTLPVPNSRGKAPRRSGRVRRPPSPLEASGESGRKSSGRRTRKFAKATPSPSPSPASEITSPPLRMPLPSPIPQIHNSAPVNSVQDMFDSLEHDLHAEQDRSQRQLQEIDKLTQQLREKEKSQTGALYEGIVPVGKRDKVSGEDDDEIEELRLQLHATRDLRTASRLALDTRDKELEELRKKHRSLIKAAKMVTSRWGGMDELAQAVEDAMD